MTAGPLKLSHFATWLASGERGISSDAIVSQLTAEPVGRGYRGADHPHDPADFRRCELLLRACPPARTVFPSRMPSRSPVWAALVEHWGELVALIESEAPGAFDANPHPGATAPSAYVRMKELGRMTVRDFTPDRQAKHRANSGAISAARARPSPDPA